MARLKTVITALRLSLRQSVRKDSKSIALLSVFSAMVAALEVFPIVGVTDLKLVPQVPSFTIDWTGIPIIVVLQGLGLVYSLISIIVMGIAIGYRNIVGAVFKVLAETLTVIGFYTGRSAVPQRFHNRRLHIIAGLLLAISLRSLGMVIVNLELLPLFVGLPSDIAYEIGIILIPWNALQAVINVIGGVLLYNTIPRDLILQAGLGDARNIESTEMSVEDDADAQMD
ncbi:MAG: hypothetical protein ACTSPE_03945 [Candidatus Thorarchaeota archaeon]